MEDSAAVPGQCSHTESSSVLLSHRMMKWPSEWLTEAHHARDRAMCLYTRGVEEGGGGGGGGPVPRQPSDVPPTGMFPDHLAITLPFLSWNFSKDGCHTKLTKWMCFSCPSVHTGIDFYRAQEVTQKEKRIVLLVFFVKMRECHFLNKFIHKEHNSEIP